MANLLSLCGFSETFQIFTFWRFRQIEMNFKFYFICTGFHIYSKIAIFFWGEINPNHENKKEDFRI